MDSLSSSMLSPMWCQWPSTSGWLSGVMLREGSMQLTPQHGQFVTIQTTLTRELLLLSFYGHYHFFFFIVNTHRGCYLGVYAALGLSQALFILFAAFSLAIASIFASRTLHSRMLKNVLRSPMSFFDTTPLGRILNRFSKDIHMIDEVIPTSLKAFISSLFSMMSMVVVVMIATPTFGIVFVPLAVIYLLVQVCYG